MKPQKDRDRHPWARSSNTPSLATPPPILRSSKAAGSFTCERFGAFELLVHMEADAWTWSYRAFDFGKSVPGEVAKHLSELAAYELRHRSGVHVFAVVPERLWASWSFRTAWAAADHQLSKQSRWLMATDIEHLRSEPRWSNALLIAGCAHEAVSATDIANIATHLEIVGTASIRACMRLCLDASDGFRAVLRLVSGGLLALSRDETIDVGSPVRLADGWDERDVYLAALACSPLSLRPRI